MVYALDFHRFNLISQSVNSIWWLSLTFSICHHHGQSSFFPFLFSICWIPNLAPSEAKKKIYEKIQFSLHWFDVLWESSSSWRWKMIFWKYACRRWLCFFPSSISLSDWARACSSKVFFYANRLNAIQMGFQQNDEIIIFSLFVSHFLHLVLDPHYLLNSNFKEKSKQNQIFTKRRMKA